MFYTKKICLQVVLMTLLLFITCGFANHPGSFSNSARFEFFDVDCQTRDTEVSLAKACVVEMREDSYEARRKSIDTDL